MAFKQRPSFPYHLNTKIDSRFKEILISFPKTFNCEIRFEIEGTVAFFKLEIRFVTLLTRLMETKFRLKYKYIDISTETL